jgi:uncharacterized protein
MISRIREVLPPAEAKAARAGTVRRARAGASGGVFGGTPRFRCHFNDPVFGALSSIPGAPSALWHHLPAPMLRLDITPFKSGVHQVELDPDPEDLEFDLEPFDDVHDISDIYVDITIQAHRDRLLLHIDVEAEAELTCSRTLKTFEETVFGQYSVLFGPEELVGTETDDYDEVRPLSRGDREVDITDVVRDTIMIAIPQRKVAPGAEEEDIAMEFGAPDDPDEVEEPVDPRWSELQKLKSDDE